MSCISIRAEQMPASPIRKLIPYADKAKQNGIKVFHLNIGQPDIPTPKPILEGIKGFEKKVLPYGPSNGLPELRETIANYFKRFNVDLSRDEVFITTGGSEAIIFTFMVICDPGDEIIIPEPFYTNYNGFAQMAGVKVIPLTTKVEEGFHLPPNGEIEKLISHRTKAILVCSPNNPTGTVLTKDEMEQLERVALKHNLFLIADEVYREFIFDGKKHTGLLTLQEIGEKAIVIDSISKRFSACGARIGFIATHNKHILDAVMKLGQARLCPPTVEQLGAIAGFTHIDEFIEETVSYTHLTLPTKA